MTVGKLEVKLSVDDTKFKEQLEELRMTMEGLEVDEETKGNIIERLTKCIKFSRICPKCNKERDMNTNKCDC